MNVPRNTPTLPRHNGGLRVKTFVYSISEAQEGDETVNAFCERHRTVSITPVRHTSKIGYAVVYYEPQKRRKGYERNS